MADGLSGKTILQYRVGEPLGAGGMGVVYRAEDTRLGRPVALKFLSSAGGAGAEGAGAEGRARLLREARAASSLRSPHVAVTHDIAEHEGLIFIVMELVEGEVLQKKLERGPLSVRLAVEVGVQTAEALDEAHGLGLIHRDIKSANLMITPRGLVKVLDFGLAKFVETREKGMLSAGASAENSSPGIIQGTVAYMSPEQALGRPLDHRTDLFSLGVVLYHCLTGRLPFEGGSLTEVIDQILHHRPQPPLALNRSVPAAISAAVERLLAKDRAERFASARELAEELTRAARELESMDGATRAFPSGSAMSGAISPPGGTAIKASSPLAPFSPSAPSSRSPRGSSGLLAGGPRSGGQSGGQSGGGQLGGQNGGNGARGSVAVMDFANITREPADDWIGTGIAETVTTDLQKVNGLLVIGRARIYDLLRDLGHAPGHEIGQQANRGAPQALDDRRAIDLGRRLGANWIVSGGYQRLGPQIRITAQFLDVQTGDLMKTVKLDGAIDRIFDLQDRIVHELARDLHLRLERTEIREIEQEETQSVEAYELRSRAVVLIRAADRDSLERGIHLLERAVDLDPDYAAAWADLGAAYNLKGNFGSLPELIEKALLCDRRAIELQPKLARAHSNLGAALSNLGRHDEAIAEMKEAIRLEPQHAPSHSWLARTYWHGKGMIPEGIEELERAVAINPEMGYAYLQLGLLHTIRGDYDRAEAACLKAVDLQERYSSGNEGLRIVGAHNRLGYVHYRRGKYDQAIHEYERELEFLAGGDHLLRERTLIEMNQKLGAAYLRQGNREAAEKHFAQAERAYNSRLARGVDDPSTQYYVACLHALRGEREKALKLLRASCEKLGPFHRARAKLDPDLDALKEEPGFQELVGG